VPAHEHFQEMCAAASIGQLPPEQLAVLERHMAECTDCRRAYADFSEIAGLEYSLRDQDTTLNSAEANRYMNSSLLRRRFLARAEDEGIVFSEHVEETLNSSKLTSFPVLSSFHTRIALAAAAAVIAVASSSFIFYRLGGRGKTVVAPAQFTPSAASVALTDQRLRDSLAYQTQLESQVSGLQYKVSDLQLQVRIATERESKAEAALDAKAADERRSNSERHSQQQSLEQLQHKLMDAESALLAARQAASEATAKSNGMQAILVADKVQINDMSDQLTEKAAELDRERQMLQAGREVRDLMAARNLHIVDVFDTDAHGKTKPIFGRIFFTEGKSLVFYAYDLNQSKVAEGEYRVWGTKDGQEKQAKSLGIFYSDDASQRRWVFKYDNPKVLDEIDSVFVTFEEPGDNSARPRRQKLMDAYLRVQPNHP
jgi:hypothetical protein